MISIEHVGLSFVGAGRRTDVLRDLNLEIPAGRFVAVIGPSGVGKSTLLRVIAGLLPPTSGRVTIAAKGTSQRLPVAMVFQDARLLPWRTVLNNAAFGLEHGMPKVQRCEKAQAALALVGLSDYAGRYPHELSGGQRQRVALARALAVEPDILLMDEPFAALDAITREQLQDELARIHAATGKTIVFVTHSIDEAVYLADEVVAITGTPGTFAKAIRITSPRPRKRDSAEIAGLASRLREELLETPAA